MRTLVISDLHLGSMSGSDVLRRPEARAALLQAVSDVDRVVLLGDVLELRHGPAREALAAARPVLSELGQALAGSELVIVAGNHDHALIEPWLARRGEAQAPEPLGLEQLLSAEQASPMLQRIAEWVAPARVLVAYPGLWLRSDVYATHGHYLDCHLTVPTLERLSVGVMSRLLDRPASGFCCVDDYEAVTAPVYAWRDAVAREMRTNAALNGTATLRAWRALGGSGGAKPTSADGDRPRGRAVARRLGSRALVGAFPLAVAALNRAGVGPLRAEISGTELRSAGLRAMAEVARRLGLGEAYVIFGHTHRAGPLPDDEPGEWGGQGQETTAQLINTGCWTYESLFVTRTAARSPYWPGSCVLVEGSGPPLVRRLLLDRTPAQLRPSRPGAGARA
jgi:predicted phosphodiesterase